MNEVNRMTGATILQTLPDRCSGRFQWMSLVIAMMLLLVLGCRTPRQEERDGIVSLIVVSQSLKVVYSRAITLDRLLALDDNSMFRDTITDSEYLGHMEEELSNFMDNPPSTKRGIAPRIVCVLARRSGRSDTLAVGGQKTLMYRRKLYGYYRPLVELIAERLPQEHTKVLRAIEFIR